MNLVECSLDQHGPRILDVFNEAIATSTALFEYEPRTPAKIEAWFAAKSAADLPVVGMSSSDGELLGFASYGPFRAWAAYKYSVEHSVYVHKDHRCKGIGRLLLAELVSRAGAQSYHLMVGGIEATNAASIGLHASMGFSHAGTIHHAGYKFGRWLDLCFYERLLPTPGRPDEC